MPPSFKDKLPILQQILQYFKKDGLVIDSPLFRLHHQMSTLIIGIGFIFISVENYLDTRSILCHSGSQFNAYAKSYCWIHGTAYVRSSLQGKATGCYVDQSSLTSEEDAPITAYYLWLPYLLSLLFVLAKAPHSAWKKFFENNLIAHILGGNQQISNEMSHNWSAFQGPGGGQGGFQGQGGGGGGRGKKKYKSGPVEIAQNYIDFRRKYAKYHRKFALWEGMNIVSVFSSMAVTHWILNYKFWNYGLLVIDYVSNYGGPKGRAMHDPMCELFPTEVACNINIGSTTGALDRTNFLCILGNNLFNQKYFFVLWLWWIFLLFVSLLGLLYRWARIALPGLSRYLLARKVHGRQLDNLNLGSADCFVLEMVVDNMKQNPVQLDQMLDELVIKLTEFNQSRLHWKIAEVEDGYIGDNYSVNRGDNYSLNTSGYLPPGPAAPATAPTESTPSTVRISEEGMPLYPSISKPSDL